MLLGVLRRANAPTKSKRRHTGTLNGAGQYAANPLRRLMSASKKGCTAIDVNAIGQRLVIKSKNRFCALGPGSVSQGQKATQRTAPSVLDTLSYTSRPLFRISFFVFKYFYFIFISLQFIWKLKKQKQNRSSQNKTEQNKTKHK